MPHSLKCPIDTRVNESHASAPPAWIRWYGLRCSSHCRRELLNQRKAGSVCQAAGWGYPRLTVPSPCPASSVNEILSPALLADTQQRMGWGREGGGGIGWDKRLSNFIYNPFINLILPPSLTWCSSFVKAYSITIYFFIFMF